MKELYRFKKYLAEGKLNEEKMDLSYTELTDDEKDDVGDMMNNIYSKINPEGDMNKNTGLFKYIDAWFESKGDSLSRGKLNEMVDEDEIASRIRKLGKENGIANADIKKYVDELSGSFEPDAYKNTTDAELLDDLKLYIGLSEGIIKENIDMAVINSHDSYQDLYIGNKAEHDAADEEEQFSDEYMIDLKPGMYQMIYWNDEGPDYMNFDNKLEYVKETISGFWGEDYFIEEFGIEDLMDAAGDDWGSAFDKHLEDNLDMYYEKLNEFINNSYPDGDSASGVVLLVNGKVVAGEATEL